jgi:hypothetical protein
MKEKELQEWIDSMLRVAKINSGEVEAWSHDKYGYEDSGYQRSEVWEAGYEAGSRTLANILLREYGHLRTHTEGDGSV